MSIPDPSTPFSGRGVGAVPDAGDIPVRGATGMGELQMKCSLGKRYGSPGKFDTRLPCRSPSPPPPSLETHRTYFKMRGSEPSMADDSLIN